MSGSVDASEGGVSSWVRGGDRRFLPSSPSDMAIQLLWRAVKTAATKAQSPPSRTISTVGGVAMKPSGLSLLICALFCAGLCGHSMATASRESFPRISHCQGIYLSEADEYSLLEAAIGDDPKRLLHLIKQGMPVNARDIHGQTPLMWAAMAGRMENMKLLIRLGADLKIRDFAGRTILMASIVHTRLEGVFYNRVISFMLARGEDINDRDNDGDTPLMLLLDTDLYFGDVAPDKSSPHDSLVSTVKLLLSKGAKVNVKNKNGKTALMLAMEPHHISSRGPDNAVAQTTLNDPQVAPQYAEVVWLLRKAGARK
jgi:hypothetical protein